MGSAKVSGGCIFAGYRKPLHESHLNRLIFAKDKAY